LKRKENRSWFEGEVKQHIVSAPVKVGATRNQNKKGVKKSGQKLMTLGKTRPGN